MCVPHTGQETSLEKQDNSRGAEWHMWRPHRIQASLTTVACLPSLWHPPSPAVHLRKPGNKTKQGFTWLPTGLEGTLKSRVPKRPALEVAAATDKRLSARQCVRSPARGADRPTAWPLTQEQAGQKTTEPLALPRTTHIELLLVDLHEPAHNLCGLPLVSRHCLGKGFSPGLPHSCLVVNHIINQQGAEI